MARSYHQGKYTPKNPEKYVGDVSNIVYRSGWEKRAMIFFDNNPSILKWGSEEHQVPYVSPVDSRVHRYFPDFLVLLKNRDGQIRRVMVEVKPSAQCKAPTGSKKTKRFLTEVSTYLVNQAKWKAATEWCNSNGFEFMIITERELGL